MNSPKDLIQLTAPCDFEQRSAIRWKNDVVASLTPQKLVAEIDLASTRSIDSNGLSALLALHEMFVKRGGQVRLINPSSVVMQLLELTSMHRLFVIAKGPSMQSPGAKRSILIVEDESIIRSVAELSLKPLGRPILFAENGRDAVSIALRDHPALILLDYMMPLMDGTETLKLLKSDAATRDIPVVVMSANKEIASGKHGNFEGAASFVVKPFNPTALRGEVQRLIQDELEVAA